MENHGKNQIVEGAVDTVHHFKIERFNPRDALYDIACREQIIRNAAEKDTENIADAEVNPCRMPLTFCRGFLRIIGRQENAGLFPANQIMKSMIGESHGEAPSGMDSCIVSDSSEAYHTMCLSSIQKTKEQTEKGPAQRPVREIISATGNTRVQRTTPFCRALRRQRMVLYSGP